MTERPAQRRQSQGQSLRRQSQGAPQTGTFPLYHAKDIIETLQEFFQLDVDPMLLTEPLDPQKIHDVYRVILLEILGISPEELDAPAADSDQVLEHPVIHTSSIAELNLWRRLSMLFNKIGINNFTYRDLTAPTFKKTRRFLSGLFNFLKYCDDKMEAYEEESNAMESLLEENDRLDDELELLRQELARVKEEIDSERDESETLLVEVTNRKRRVQELNQKQAVLSGVIKDKKIRNTTLHNDVSQLKAQVIAREDDANHLKAQIVKSPEKVKKLLRDMEKQLETDRETILEGDRKWQHLQQRIQAIAKIEAEIKKCIILLNEAEGVANNIHNAKDKTKEQKGEMQQKQMLLRELKAREVQQERLIENVKLNTQRLDSVHIPKIKALEDTLLKSEQELLRSNEMEAQVQRRIRQNETDEKDLELVKERMVREYDMEMDRMRENYEALEADLAHYNLRLQQVIATGSRV